MMAEYLRDRTKFHLILEIPLPPSGVNHIYKNRRAFTAAGKPYTAKMLTPEAKQWKLAVALKAKSEKVRSGLPANSTIFREKFAVNVWAWWRDCKSQIDADGSLKLVLDALQDAGIFSSDKFALPRWQDFAFDARNPRMLLEIICPPPSPWGAWVTKLEPRDSVGEVPLDDFTVTRRKR